MSKNQDSKINKESSTQKLEPEKLENVNGGAKNIKHIVVAYGVNPRNEIMRPLAKYGAPPKIESTKPLTVAYGVPPARKLTDILPTTTVEEKEPKKSEDNPLNPIVNPTSK